MDALVFPTGSSHQNVDLLDRNCVTLVKEASTLDDGCWDTSEKLFSGTGGRMSFSSTTEIQDYEESDELMNLLDGIRQHANQLQSELYLIQNINFNDTTETLDIQPGKRCNAFPTQETQSDEFPQSTSTCIVESETMRTTSPHGVVSTSSLTSLVKTKILKRRKKYPPAIRSGCKDKFARKMIQPVVGWLRRWTSTSKHDAPCRIDTMLS